MDLSASGLMGDQVAQEGDELCRGVPLGGAAPHLARAGVEGCVERERAVAVVRKAVALSAPRGKRQHGIEPVERLNGRFLVEAEYRRVLRRLEVEPDDV